MNLATLSAMAADGDLLSQSEQEEIAVLLQAMKQVAQGEDAHLINAAVEDLAKGTEAFAAERMNRGIRQALAGRNIEQL
jgi:molecular chaperone HscA